jgi:hypothetical protein
MGIAHYSFKFIKTLDLTYFARNFPLRMHNFVRNAYLLFVYHRVLNSTLILLNAGIKVDQSCCFLFKKEIKRIKFKFIVMCLKLKPVYSGICELFIRKYYMCYFNEVVIKSAISRR